MKGGIYPTKYGWQVRFGKITKRFKRHEHTEKPHRDLTPAERFLNGLRYETDKGSFDVRDYQKSNPLGFKNMAEKWLNYKARIDIKPKTLKTLERFINQASEVWGDRNIKLIGASDIEDFLYSRSDITNKTRSNIKSCLHDFWTWVCRREKIPMPEFPTISYTLGMRKIIDLNTQQKIVDEIKNISYHINPKIWLAVKFLTTYIAVRPGELISIRENNIDLTLGTIVVPHPKEKEPKFIFLLDEDIELIKQFPRGLPEVYFFRHAPGISGVKAGQKFGQRYLYKWWKKACSNLGIEGVDLYGGTRHSTATALSKHLTPEQIKAGTMHATNKAFERYFQTKARDALVVYEKIREVKTDNEVITFPGKSKNSK